MCIFHRSIDGTHMHDRYRAFAVSGVESVCMMEFFYMEQAKLARFLLSKKVKGDERYGKHNSGITW